MIITEKTTEALKPDRILLPAGVTRRIRVNSDALLDGEGKVFRVESPSGKENYDIVEILGPSRTGTAKSTIEGRCGPITRTSAYIETEAAILVN